jgi:four helix bundle protein
MHNFRRLSVSKKSMDVARDSYALTRALPRAEMYGLASQIQRAAVSIASNIAEGSSRTSDKEFRRFLQIALGSAYELEVQLDLARMAGYIPESETEQLRSSVVEVQRMLYSLIAAKKPIKPKT